MGFARKGGRPFRKLQNQRIVEEFWKTPPESIIAAYTKYGWSFGEHPSKAGYEEPCLNSGGPSPKAKYYYATDSEPVP